jgi:crotonobetainyl-CoA:carnitine CoA-transferase CaiB-like acyl-CoA transferase
MSSSTRCAADRPSGSGRAAQGQGEAIWALRRALEHPEWCEAPRFATNQARMANPEALEDAMSGVLTTKTTNDWVEVLETADVPCGPVCAQMLADPQVRHRGLVQYGLSGRMQRRGIDTRVLQML